MEGAFHQKISSHCTNAESLFFTTRPFGGRSRFVVVAAISYNNTKLKVMNRKHFVKFAGLSAAVTLTGPLAGCANKTAGTQAPSAAGNVKGAKTGKAVYVANGKNRFQEELMIWGIIPLQIKVSGKDSDDSIFVFEHTKMGKGGPPRHFHFEQDEWFYAMEGKFAFEVGDEKFTLHPGDSLFAPRMVPHVWACTGENPGTLLLAVQPAGSLEEFFMKSCDMTRPPTTDEADRLFAAHGMKVVGPPLTIS
jgi:mannose-6-phosphate isomerase-like protein (cupin superfamily)